MALPTDISNLKLWLRADSLSASLSNNDPVTTWEDESGQNNDATQATAAKKPLFKTNQLILNALPALYFDGTGSDATADNLDFTTAMASGNFTLFVVVRPAGDNNFVFLGPTNSYAYNDYLYYYDPASSNLWNCYDGINNPQSSVLAGNHSDWKILAQDNNNVDTTRFFEYSTGSEVAKGTGGRFNWLNYFRQRIGGNYNNTIAGAGYIAEIVFYDALLSDANRQAIGTYLYNKYFVTPTIYKATVILEGYLV